MEASETLQNYPEMDEQGGKTRSMEVRLEKTHKHS